MVSIFKDLLDSVAYDVVQPQYFTTYTTDYDYDFEDYGIDLVTPIITPKEKNSTYCVEIIIRYTDGKETILPIPSSCKIVSIPKYDTDTKLYYQDIRAIDIGYIKQGYRHAVRIETEHRIEGDNIKSIEIFQNREDHNTSVILGGNVKTLFDFQIASKYVSEGVYTRIITLIGKELISENKDEQ